MRKRANSDGLPDEPAKKKSATNCETLRQGEILTDISGKKWRLGKTVGLGGFGDIYLASDNIEDDVKSDSSYVAKLEDHSNGPLFVEINCYLRIAKQDMIKEWMETSNIQHLGMPHYVASGSHTCNGVKYRFLILPRYEKDLEFMLKLKRKFNIKTVLMIAVHILDTLQYIHSKGYVHSDVKASNILLGQSTSKPEVVRKQLFKYRVCNPPRSCKLNVTRTTNKRNLRPISKISYVEEFPNFDEFLEDEDDPQEENKQDQVYLLDYGLASKYVTVQNKHKQFCNDERRAHAGTLLFCSRDAHKGAQSRRSDLECLGYNMIYWLTGILPWMDDTDPEIVHKKKQRCVENIDHFLRLCFSDCPKFMKDYFQYLQKLDFEEKPNYNFCKKLFKTAIRDYGYSDDNGLDFDNKEGWGCKPQKNKKHSENRKMKKPVTPISYRFPLQSNLPVKPKLRKKVKDKQKASILKWSRILIDPEGLLKQKKVRDRKLTESSDSTNGSLLNMDIHKLNPTYAMMEVFNKSKERMNNSPVHKSDEFPHSIEGYTPAMLAVYNRMKENQEFERNLQQDSPEPSKRNYGKKRVFKPKQFKRKAPVALYSPPRNKKRTMIASKKIEPALNTRREKIVSLRRNYSLRG